MLSSLASLSTSYQSLRKSASHTESSSFEYQVILLLNSLATNSSLKYYLTAFRLLTANQQTSLAILIEQFDLRMIDFWDVEAVLGRAARDPSQDVNIVQMALQIYFLEIRVKLDGPDIAAKKLEQFLT